MPLLPTRNLAELLLRCARHEPLHPLHDLEHALRLHDVVVRLPDQRLDLDHAVLVQVRAQPVVQLGQDLPQEAVGVALGGSREGLVDEAASHELRAGQLLGHDEGLVGLGDAEALHEAEGGAAFADQAERAEGREEEGVRRRVDEVAEPEQGRGQADRGAVQGGDQDLGVGVETARDVEVVGHEAAHDLAAGCVRVCT